MSKLDYSHIKILRLCVIRHENFQGRQDFVFDQKRTLIAGGNGTGKSTLMNILENIDSDTGANFFDGAGDHQVEVEVITSGNREWIQKYRQVIFINGNDPINVTSADCNILNHLDQMEVINDTRKNFEAILEKKPWKIDIYKDLNPDLMALGEQMCFKYATIFAIRYAINVDLPVIIKSPYGILDNELKEGFNKFLDRQTCQQILLGTPAEFQAEKVHYNLGND